MTSVLVLGQLPAALEVTRSLGESGQRIIVGTSSFYCYANLSRHCAETWHHPPLTESTDAFVTALNTFLRSRPDITTIFPTDDIYIVRLSENRDRLPGEVKLVTPDHHVIRLSDDKLAMHELLDTLNIPQAAYAVARSKADLFNKCDDLGYPCVILHVDSFDTFLGQKALIIDSREHLEAVFRDRPDFNGRLLLRAFATGTRYNYYLVACEGRIIDGIQMKITLTDRFDNTGSQVESCSQALMPALTHYSEKLLSHLNYTGPGMTQFIVDEETGKIVFLEVNPRLGANCAMARHAGIDLVRIAFDLCGGRLPEEPRGQSSYPVDLRFGWLGGALNGLKRDWRRGSVNLKQALVWLARLIVMSVRADAHICWRWNDPLPALGCLFSETFFAFRKRVGRLPRA